METVTIKQEPDESKVDLDSVLSSKPARMMRRRRGWFAWILNISARLFIWSCVFTILFRCPSSVNDLSGSSPKICKPYLLARSWVFPYVQPYYNEYAAPYVDLALPHVDRFQRSVYTPAVSFGKEQYSRYAAPGIDEAQKLAILKWDKTVRPRLDNALARARGQYDQSIAPVVDQAVQVSEPYIDRAKSTVLHQYHSNAVPAYEKSLPYVQQTYQHGRRITMEIVLPYARYGTDLVFHFLTRRVWPKLSILYGENVEPQLVKIRERLANYRDAKNIEAVVDDFDLNPPTVSSVSSSDASSATVSGSSIALDTDATSVDSIESSSTKTIDSITVTDSSAALKETRRQISEDLKIWQEKFKKAADRGADDLRDRVTTITAQQISSQVQGVGEALVVQLEESVSDAFEKIKTDSKSTIDSLHEDSSDEDIHDAVEHLRTSIKLAGKSIKEKAQNVRTWKVKFDFETSKQIRSAKDSTLDVIDNIRDLGLQEIGMRWASMDGVTYKDWSEYHTLKKTFDEWRVTVENVAVNHEGVLKAKSEGDDIESKAMAIAEDAAIELARLKDVILWKIDARDSSDDFSTRILPAKAVKAGKSVLDGISSAGAAIIGSTSTQGSIDSILSKASDGATAIVSSAVSVAAEVQTSMSVVSSSIGSRLSSGAAAGSSIASPVSSVASSAVEDAFSRPASSPASVVSQYSSIQDLTTGSGLLRTVSEMYDKIVGSSLVVEDSLTSMTADVGDNFVTQASEQASSLFSKASSEIPIVNDPTSSTASDAKASIPVNSGSNQQSVVSAAKEKIKSATDAIKGSSPPPADYVSSASESATKYLSSVTNSASSAVSAASIIADTIQSVVSDGASNIAHDQTESESAKEAWSRSIQAMVSSKKAAAAAQKSATIVPSGDTSSEDPMMSYSQNIHEAIKKAGERASEITASLMAEHGADAVEETNIPNWSIEL